MADITVKGPEGTPVTYVLDRERVTVGRASTCHIVVRDGAVSRLHLQLRREGTNWVLSDESSRHGTLLNGKAVTGPRVLHPGDEVTLGNSTLVFDARVPHAVRESDELPTASLVPWSARGAETGEGEPALVGGSVAIREVLGTVERVAPSLATVLVTGESGTGKELVARLLHRRSGRAGGPFVVVNCPALPGTLIESELFGVQPGAATGVEARTGKFEAAAGGTLFLDEVGDLEPAAQAKLLRALGEHTIEHVGGGAPIAVDVRVVAATNHDLRADVEQGSFRRDLYHRLDTVVVTLPALRQRREDIPLLVEHFVGHGGGGTRKPFSPEALAVLSRHGFPGNVRELEHLVERSGLLAPGSLIEVADLPGHVREQPVAAHSHAAAVSDLLYERVVTGGESFWDVVHAPFLRRRLAKRDVRQLVGRLHAEAGHSYLEMARLMRIEGDYRKLLNFLHHHDLKVGR